MHGKKTAMSLAIESKPGEPIASMLTCYAPRRAYYSLKSVFSNYNTDGEKSQSFWYLFCRKKKKIFVFHKQRKKRNGTTSFTMDVEKLRRRKGESDNEPVRSPRPTGMWIFPFSIPAAASFDTRLETLRIFGGTCAQIASCRQTHS